MGGIFSPSTGSDENGNAIALLTSDVGRFRASPAWYFSPEYCSEKPFNSRSIICNTCRS